MYNKNIPTRVKVNVKVGRLTNGRRAIFHTCHYRRNNQMHDDSGVYNV